MNGKSFWSYCLWLMIVLSTARMAYTQDPIPLTPGQPQEQVLTGAKPIRFRIQLQKGQFMRALVAQSGLDMTLELFDANDKSLVVRNLSTVIGNWDESLSVEAPAAGVYFLSVKFTYPFNGSMKFSTQVEVLPQVTNKEQALLEAEQLLHEAHDAVAPRGGSVTSQQIEERRTIAYRKWQQARPLYQLVGDRYWEGFTLNRLCAGAPRDEQREEAAKYGEQALAIWRERNDREREASTLNEIGLALFDVTKVGRSSYAKQAALFCSQAIPWHEKALAIYRELNLKRGIGDSLMRLGEAYGGTSQPEKRYEYFEQALAIFRELKWTPGQRLALTRLGNSYRYDNQPEKAVLYYEESLKLSNVLNAGDLQVVQMMSALYGELDNVDKAIEYTEKLLALSRSLKLPDREAMSLRFLAEGYREKKMYAQALEYAEKGMAISREYKIRHLDANESAFRETEGRIYLDMGQPEKAISLLEPNVAVIRQIKNPLATAAGFYITLGKAYRLNKQYDLALEQHLLAIRDSYNRKSLEPALAWTYGEVMWDLQAKGQTEAAIFWGKQAINLNQDVRRNIRGLDEKTRKDFLKAREEAYRHLADLLISLGRLPEAEQVIRMLKEEEYYEYVRRDDNNAPTNVKTTMTPEEAVLEKRFREIADSLIEIGEQRSGLLAKPTRSTEEDSLLTKLESDLSVANQTFQKFLDTLSVELSAKANAQQKVYQLRESQGLMEDLRELGKGVAALYTLVGEEKFRVILTNADVQKAYEFPIKGADLNRKVLAFRDALQNKQTDPRQAAQELYQILLGPVAKDLQKMKATTLMWSLDGVLRYVPIAALYDGEKYLVERYNNIVFTPASNARMKDTPRAKWEALGLGVTRGFENVPPLPAVADEMRSIIKDAATPNANGILPGTIKLDDQFTQEAMLTALRARPAVVHVASHFQFKPGNETNSALLLGDGKFLSLAQIKSMPNVFGGVELLTLSACNTATGSSTANGKEVEGFGVLAQRQGAKAVVASLWPVDDRTTRLLMEEFYRGRETNKLSKGDALRQAQLKLLRGELNRAKKATEPSREIIHEAAAPTLPKDTKRPFQHPYYWAPFIMIGNWR